MSRWVWVIAITLGTIVFVVLILYFVSKSMVGKLKPIAQALGGEVAGNLLKGSYCLLNRDGVEVQIGIQPGSQYTPPVIYIKELRPGSFKMTLYKENAATRGLEKLGMLKDLKIGDPLFDEKYVIKSGDEIGAINFLQDPRRREAIEAMFDDGFHTFQLDKKSVMIQQRGYKKQDLDPERLRINLERLHSLFS